MALSEQVETSLKEAQENLRNALSFSARSEKSYVSKHIADMLANIDNLVDATELIEKLENRKEGDSGFFGTFYD
jgi:molecular chaperone GrpE (heat shock protein)|tara:strand:+ start:55 stop:276 length:222 start_codon:yes stop_codon:yes gene_type:complete